MAPATWPQVHVHSLSRPRTAAAASSAARITSRLTIPLMASGWLVSITWSAAATSSSVAMFHLVHDAHVPSFGIAVVAHAIPRPPLHVADDIRRNDHAVIAQHEAGEEIAGASIDAC